MIVVSPSTCSAPPSAAWNSGQKSKVPVPDQSITMPATKPRSPSLAFWITKLGDLGFVAGIVMLWSGTGTFDFWPLFQAAEGGALHVGGLTTIVVLGVFGA